MYFPFVDAIMCTHNAASGPE